MKNLAFPSKPTKKTDSPNPHKTGKPSKKTLRTIRQVYDMCKTYKCSDTYNNIKIGQMLIVDRSIFMYPRGIFGYRLVEAKVKSGCYYDNNAQTIILHTPINDNKYQLLLKIIDKGLFNKVRNEFFNNRDKIILISGNWQASKTFNMFYAEVTSKKQYHVIIH